MKNETLNTDAVYFKSLTIENVLCFKEEQTIDFTGKDGKPAKWTVILGNNNTGKTTLLRCLTDMMLIEREVEEEISEKIYIAKGNWLRKKIHNRKLFFNNSCEYFFKEKSIHVNIFNIKKEANLILRRSILRNKVLFDSFFILGYNIFRKNIFSKKENQNKTVQKTFVQPEKWLIQTDYAVKNGATKAKQQLLKIKNVLINILPDVCDFRFTTDEKTFNSYVEVKTDYGWIKMQDLGYGYQSLLTWVIDLAKKMFDRYPESETPLQEPAIVLIDEIDLHLHPEWQRKIIRWLSSHFPNVQFIATSHSPLVVQSADDINIILLEKEGNQVKINQPNIHNFQGWTVEEILTELMGLKEGVYSDKYLQLMAQFDEALDEDNYEKAQNAYKQLTKILHPSSHQRKLLRIQMAGLSPQLELV